MCDNCVAFNAAIARAQYKTNDIRFEISSTQVWEQLKHENFVSQYILFSTLIQYKFCIIRMRLFNFTISLYHIYIICLKLSWIQLHESLMILKVRFENLTIFLFENSNFQLIRTNSSRLSSVIHWSRILSIFDRFFVKQIFIRKINISNFISEQNILTFNETSLKSK